MKRRFWISLLLVALALTAALWALNYQAIQHSEVGFNLVSSKDNSVLISDVDVLYYNWTSQEMVLSNAASQRLIDLGQNLYSFTGGFIIRIDGEEVYRGIFRSSFMSALPEPPKISIIYPSIVLPSESENNNAIRLFYPGFQPPNDQPENNFELSEYFAGTGRLSY